MGIRKLCIWFTTLLIICGKNVTAQLSSVMPPLPEAASFFKSTDIPVSLYTGVANINVPFHTIKTGEIEIPVGLNYNARGITVAEVASRAGLGWAMQYGGMITRQIRGSADEGTYGILNTGYYNDVFTDATTQSRLNSDIVNNNVDQVPDEFYYDVNGENGKFIIDFNDRSVVLQKFGDLKIIPNTTFGKITSWVVTDKLGNKFYYGKSKDGSREANDYNFVSENYFFGQHSSLKLIGNDENRWINTWHLMEIDTYLKEKIEFFYEQEQGIQYRRHYDEFHTSDGSTGELRDYFSKDVSYQYQIKEIRYPAGKVEFISDKTASRKDYTNTHSLKELLVKDGRDSIIKRFELSYFYQRCVDDNNQLAYLKEVDTTANYRLFLNSVREVNQDGDSLPPYRFEYSPVLLPNRFSNSQDNWGYYNGKANGSYLTFNNYGTPNDREVDTALSGAGLLNKITYPTGGYTIFTLEQNRIKPLWFIDSLLYNKNNPTEISVKGDALFKDSAYYADGVFSKIITIGTDLQPLTDVEFSFVPPFVPPGADSSIIYYHVKLQSLDSTLSIYLYPPDTERELDIGPGDYKLIVIPTGANDPNNPYRSFIAGLRWSVLNMNADSLENNEWYGAGKRIKKIESWNSGQLESVKEYEYLNDSSQSSGQMIGLPNYYWIEKIVPGSGPIVEGYGSEPSSPLSQIQGNSLGYSRVTEYSGTRTMNQGKTVYEFTVNTDGGEYYKMPYYLPIDYEWIRGKPLSTKIYKNNGGSYELQRSIENKYLYAGTNSANIFSRAFTTPDNPVYVYRKDRKLFYLPLFTFAPCGEFDIDAPLCNTIYYQSAGTADLASTTEKTYANGQILTNVTNYGYDYERLYQPIKKTILTSTGDSVVSTFTYPPELISRTAPEQKLVDLNRIAVPIKTEIITKNSSGIQLAKTIKNIIYKDWGNDVVLPELMQSAINSEPLMTDATFNKYNPFGSPREITLKSGVKEVYVWGYKQQYPVAKITGSDYNTIIAFVDTTVLENASQYTDAQIRTELNKIRTGLAGTSAQVVTYTYTPSIGISSITDQRNRTVFYEYDAYGRLSLIRDHDNNILKKYCYNYAGQSEDCSTGCAPDWQSTGNYRCVKDSNNHNTGFQEREERNMESCSSTYNQTRWVNNGYNASACTPYIPCSSGNCDSRGPQYKCVDGVCETGFKVFTDSHFDSSIGHYVCTYHYEWSDDTWSQDYTQVNPGMFQCNLN